MTALAPRSIKAEHVDLGVLGPEHLRITSNGGSPIGAGSTTSTASYVAAASFALHLPTPRVQFRAPFLLQMQHSAATWDYELFVALYNEITLVTGQTLWYVGGGAPDSVRAPVGANLWVPVSGVGIGYPDAAGIEAGTRYLAVVVKNRTAGTLSWSRGTGYDFVGFDLVGY